MATATGKARCVICGKEKSTLRCEGCLQTFCYNHVGDHRQQLSKQLEDVEVSRDLFRQTLIEFTTNPQKHPLLEQIDQWERDSINKIQQTAEEARQTLLKHTARNLTDIEVKLNKLTNELREGRQENDFFETDLQKWTEELRRLEDIINKPSDVVVKHDTIPLVCKIFVDVSVPSYIPNIGANATWAQNGITVAGGNGNGNGVNQMSTPYNLYVYDDQTIYIADKSNHHIVEWKIGAKSGQVVAGGNGPGNQNNQLNNPMDVIIDKENDALLICDYTNRRVTRWPRRNGANGETIISDICCYGLAMDSNGYLYVSDHNKHEVRRWRIGDTNGTIVAGGNGQGDRLDQLNGPTYIFVDQNHSVYISDYNNYRVMKWPKGATEGIVVAGGQKPGDSVIPSFSPGGVVVDQSGNVYVTDFHNQQVMRWSEGAVQGIVVIGGNGEGDGANQFYDPWGLSFDKLGNLYVVDSNNYRVQKFNINPSSSS